MQRSLLRATALAIAAFALAAAAPSPDLPDRTINLVVYGADRCPEPEGDEIVVCARKPEGERYRIPPALRTAERPEETGATSWGARVAETEDVTRFTRPGGCSAVGSDGQTGCMQNMIRQWYGERRGHRH